jgi:hypothetical protein
LKGVFFNFSSGQQSPQHIPSSFVKFVSVKSNERTEGRMQLRAGQESCI